VLREAVLVTPRFTTLALPPLQLRVGDRVLHANGEWKVIGGPWSMTAGETVYVHPALGRSRHEEGAGVRAGETLRAPRSRPGDTSYSAPGQVAHFERRTFTAACRDAEASGEVLARTAGRPGGGQGLVREVRWHPVARLLMKETRQSASPPQTKIPRGC